MCEFWQYSCGHTAKTQCGVPHSHDEAIPEETELFKKLSKYKINGPSAVDENTSPKGTPIVPTGSINTTTFPSSTTTTLDKPKYCTGFPKTPKITDTPCYNCILKQTHEQMALERPIVEQMKAQRTGAGNDNWGYSSQGMVGYGEGGDSSWHGQWSNEAGGGRGRAAGGLVHPSRQQRHHGQQLQQMQMQNGQQMQMQQQQPQTYQGQMQDDELLLQQQLQQQQMAMPMMQQYGPNMEMNMGMVYGPAGSYAGGGQAGMGNTHPNVNTKMIYPAPEAIAAGRGMYVPTPLNPLANPQHPQHQYHMQQYLQQRAATPPQPAQPISMMASDMGLHNQPPAGMGGYQFGQGSGNGAGSGQQFYRPG